ncbi:nucleotide exchange factor GrpE [Tissierella creatinini]|nr:nucleotide exchange factor GrpE [Tissierella creatinini]TJX67180.1 nucleotide exchange factor GrpE [Soehngenia saccharolytica]
MGKEEFEVKDMFEDIDKAEESVKSNDEQTTDLDRDLIGKKDEEISELNNKLLRLQADFVNYKKRSEKDRENSIDYGFEAMACELLPIIDNFQRALETEVDKEDGFYNGILMIKDQLINMLNKNNVVEIEAVGSDFDPNFHHAVFMEESQEIESGKVIEVLQKGYKYKEKVIRPAMVKVAK